MSDIEDQENKTVKRSCSGLKEELIQCLRKSECMQKVRTKKTLFCSFTYMQACKSTKKYENGNGFA